MPPVHIVQPHQVGRWRVPNRLQSGADAPRTDGFRAHVFIASTAITRASDRRSGHEPRTSVLVPISSRHGDSRRDNRSLV